MMKCLNCNKELVGKQTSYCSVSCKKKYIYNNTVSKKSCAVCRKEFEARLGVKYCSDKCSLKAQRKNKKVCPMCNKKFLARGNGVYCSNVCYRTANSSTKGLMVSYCKVCGQSFKTLISNPEVVCSDSCSTRLFSVYINETLIEVFGTTDKNQIQTFLKDNFQKEMV